MSDATCDASNAGLSGAPEQPWTVVSLPPARRLAASAQAHDADAELVDLAGRLLAAVARTDALDNDEDDAVFNALFAVECELRDRIAALPPPCTFAGAVALAVALRTFTRGDRLCEEDTPASRMLDKLVDGLAGQARTEARP